MLSIKATALLLASLLPQTILALPSPLEVASEAAPTWEIFVDEDLVPIERTIDRRGLQKRADHAITCTGPDEPGKTWVFDSSACIRPGTKEYQCQAHAIGHGEEPMFDLEEEIDRHEVNIVAGQCQAHQLCVDGRRHDVVEPFSRSSSSGSLELTRSESMAYCSDIAEFVNLSTNLLRQIRRTQSLTMYYMSRREAFRSRSQGAPANHSAELVFTGATEDTVIVMPSLSITAQSSTVDLAQGRQWTDLGTESCVNCNSIGFKDIPEHTSRFIIHPVFPADMTKGLAYLWSK